MTATLLALAACALLAGCATAPHWRPEHARPHPPSAWRLSSSPAELVPPVPPWWEDYRPLIPREQDTCALLQQSAHSLHPQQALALWSWLARAPLSLRTFAPRTALAWLSRHVLSQGRRLPASELRPLCERFLALVVMRPDGYLASASSGQPFQRMGEVALRDSAFIAGNFVVGRLYLSRGGIFYPLDDELRLSSDIPLGELGLDKDLVNTALDGAAECTRGRDALSPQNTKSRAALTSDCPSHNGQTIHRLLEGRKRQTSARTDPCESLLRTGPVLVHSPSKGAQEGRPSQGC